MMREHLMEQEYKTEKKRDKKLQKISKKWKDELTLKEEERKKLLEETRDQRKSQRKSEWEKRKKKYESLVKKNEDRLTEKQEKLEEISKSMKEQHKEQRDATKEQREQWKEEHDQFLEKQKEKLEKEMEALVNERKELANIKTEFETKEKETMNNVKGKVMKYFEQNKQKLLIEKKEKEDVSKFIEKPAVKEVFEKYDTPLKYFFDFYSRSEHHAISHKLDEDMETMNYKEFIRFGYQSNIVPAMLPIDEMNHTFRLLVRERQTETNNDSTAVLDYKYFVKAIVRIAAIAQDNLGGQKGPRLEKKVEEMNKEKQRTQKLKKTLAKKFGNSMKKKNQTDNDSEHSLDRGAETSGNETEKSKPEISKRGAKKPRKKVIKESLKDETLKNAKVLKSVVSEAEILKRKSKNVNSIIKEGTRADILDHIKNVKVEDKRVSAEVDVKLITAKTIEALLNFLQLQPEDNKYTLDKKLNKVIRHNAGAKPNRIVKKIQFEKAEVVDKDTSDEDNDDQTHSKSPVTNKSKTEKTDNSGSEDEDDGNTTKN